MNLQPALDQKSPRTPTELEFDVLGVATKLVKYVIQLFERNK
jgi:hypothetical protein